MFKIMRISIMGSHGTGKSTLAKELCKNLGYNFIPDTAALAFKKNFEINEATPTETQFWILSKQLEYERNTKESWIIEKSLYDNMIYARFSNQPEIAIKTMQDIIERNAKYDKIFYLPIEFAIQDDGIRSLDTGFQKAVDINLRKYLKDNKLDYIVLNGSVKNRTEKALEILCNAK